MSKNGHLEKVELPKVFSLSCCTQRSCSSSNTQTLGFEFGAQQFGNCLRKHQKGSIPFPDVALAPTELLIKVFQVFLSFKLKSSPGKQIQFGSSTWAASPEFPPQLPSPQGVRGVPRRDKYIPHQKRASAVIKGLLIPLRPAKILEKMQDMVQRDLLWHIYS